MDDHDIEAIERATLAAVPPQAMTELEGWLLPFDDGTVGRAHSAVPLRHTVPEEGIAEAIARRYRGRGAKPVLRLPDAAAFDAMLGEIASTGWAAGKPTLVQMAPLDGLLALRAPADVGLHARPQPGWAGVFLGEGFDPADGASRVAILQRSPDTLYASVSSDGQVVAVGAACYSHGWCGIHGMRTAATHRGRGFATAILRAMALEAEARGIGRCFLQVEEANATARSAYARAGFATQWRYRYWHEG